MQYRGFSPSFFDRPSHRYYSNIPGLFKPREDSMLWRRPWRPVYKCLYVSTLPRLCGGMLLIVVRWVFTNHCWNVGHHHGSGTIQRDQWIRCKGCWIWWYSEKGHAIESSRRVMHTANLYGTYCFTGTSMVSRKLSQRDAGNGILWEGGPWRRLSWRGYISILSARS